MTKRCHVIRLEAAAGMPTSVGFGFQIPFFVLNHLDVIKEHQTLASANISPETDNGAKLIVHLRSKRPSVVNELPSD